MRRVCFSGASCAARAWLRFAARRRCSAQCQAAPCFPLSTRLSFLDELGYAISNVGFRGPWLEVSQINKGAVKLAGVNLFAVKRNWLAAQKGRRL